MVEVFNLIAHQGGYLAQALVTRADADFGKGSHVSLEDEAGQMRTFCVHRMGLATSGIQSQEQLLVDLELKPFIPSSNPSPKNED